MRIVGDSEPWGPDIDADECVVAITRDELVGLANSIGQTLMAVDEWEFHSLVGLSPSEARTLLDQIDEILGSSFRPQ